MHEHDESGCGCEAMMVEDECECVDEYICARCMCLIFTTWGVNLPWQC
jgi:hypothetical protein